MYGGGGHRNESWPPAHESQKYYIKLKLHYANGFLFKKSKCEPWHMLSAHTIDLRERGRDNNWVKENPAATQAWREGNRGRHFIGQWVARQQQADDCIYICTYISARWTWATFCISFSVDITIREYIYKYVHLVISIIINFSMRWHFVVTHF